MLKTFGLFDVSPKKIVKRCGGNMLNTEHWEQIISDYKTAWNCLVCPKHCNEWHREENKCLFYLLKAYLAAVEEPEKDHLWYARILKQMAYPGHFNISDYERFKKYIEPAMAEYDLVDESEKFEKEISMARQEYEVLKAQNDFKADDGEKSYKRYLSLIENSELFYEKDVWFHDGKVISFKHENDTATLKYEYDNYIVTIGFDGILDIHLYYDTDEYICDFYCYPVFPDKTNTKVFDIGSHKITCKTIKVMSIEKV